MDTTTLKRNVRLLWFITMTTFQLLCLSGGTVLGERAAAHGEIMTTQEWKSTIRLFIEHLSREEEGWTVNQLLRLAGPADEVDSDEVSATEKPWRYVCAPKEPIPKAPLFYFSFHISNDTVVPMGGGGGGYREGDRTLFKKLLSQVKNGWTMKQLLDNCGPPISIQPGAEKSDAEWRYSWIHRAERGSETDTFTFIVRRNVVIDVKMDSACQMFPRGKK
jgi:hypothetical protein